MKRYIYTDSERRITGPDGEDLGPSVIVFEEENQEAADAHYIAGLPPDIVDVDEVMARVQVREEEIK